MILYTMKGKFKAIDKETEIGDTFSQTTFTSFHLQNDKSTSRERRVLR